jgi:mRNA-degrading endonuclease RelE of RelBE toxin-antitoxin system
VALILSRACQKQMEAMPKLDRDRLMARLRDVAADPARRHPNVTAILGESGVFRVRQGDWRAVFAIEGGDVIVDRVGHRREVYR